MAVSGYPLIRARSSSSGGPPTVAPRSSALALFALGPWVVAIAREIWRSRPTPWRLAAAGASVAALYAVIAGRAIQGFAAGALVPVAMALVGDLFPEGRRAFPLGLVGAMDTAGWVLGHLWGGVVVQVFPWQAIFWINLPIAAVAIVVAWRWLPRPGPGGTRATTGWSGTVAPAGLNLALSGTEASRAGLGVLIARPRTSSWRSFGAPRRRLRHA